jgi:signal transduction histidine kinase
MGRVCTDAVDEVRASVARCEHPGETSVGGSSGQVDSIRLGQLLGNLLPNGVRYGAGPVTVEAGGDASQVTLVVSNEGNPIPEHALPTLFDPLTRAGPPDRRGTAAGMGLGLYICRCIASAHQGTIAVTSSESGTHFTVCLPRSPA